MWTEDRWDVADPPVLEVLAGPVTELCDPPDEMPKCRPAGFTAKLEGWAHAGEQTHH